MASHMSCASPKLCPAVKSTACTTSSTRQFAMTVPYVPISLPLVGSHVVAPETVVRWHRAGFRLYWSMISTIRKRLGRSRIPREVRDLIFRRVAENPTWGAPRIHGELLKLASTFLNARFPVGSNVRREILNRRSAGRPSCRTIAKPLQRWTSLLFPPLPSACSTASLLLPMIGGGFCMSM